MDTPIIVEPDQAQVYNLGLGEAHILVDGARSAGAWWLGEFREDPGFMTPMHFHPQQDEHFYVLDGVLALYFAGKWLDIHPGTYATIPHGVEHAQGNTSDHPVKFLAAGNPAGFEKVFAELDLLFKRISRTDPQFQIEGGKILAKYDTKVVSPPPRRT
ncbi:MAG TPA: cupin domain-containing protein [Terriglobales bacterium]